MPVRRSPLLLTALTSAALVLSACGGQGGAYEDGTQTVPLAGLGAEIDAAGVEVLAADTPSGATDDAVADALTDAKVVSPLAARPGDDAAAKVVAFDPTATAGLLSLVVDGPESTVVLVFASADSAAVFAAADPDVFADTVVETSRKGYLTGNLVGYAGDDSGRPTRLRRALNALGGS